MNTNNNPYNNRQVGNDKSQMTNVLHGSTPPQIPLMPPPPMPRQSVRNTWRQRLLGGGSRRPLTLQQERTIPAWVVGPSIAFYFVAMFACWIVFGYVPELDLILISGISVLLFTYGGYTMAKAWCKSNEGIFLRNIMITGFCIRLLWVLYQYYIFNPAHYGSTYGDSADVAWYIPFGQDVAQWLIGESRLSFSEIIDVNAAAIDDTGYSIWLGVVYALTMGWSDVFIPFVLKCILGAYCAVSIYRVAKRHFGNSMARLAAIFICVNPNMIYWCGTMMKETEMVFLCCLAIDNFDRVLTSGQKFTFKNLLPGMLAGLALMFFRTVLGLVIFLAVFAHIVMASRRVMSIGKKIIASILVAVTLFMSMGDRIQTQSRELIESARSDTQEKSMQWRARREGGNEFAKYAGAAVFAPLIFTMPFPTFNAANQTQLTQMILSGGSYIKNVLSFFVIWVMFIMLISGEWRRHVFILAYTSGYLLVLVMSQFAQSGRFHMPVWPMLMLFAAYGIQLSKTNPRLRKWFPLVLVIEVMACLAWNWYKLAGRGMI